MESIHHIYDRFSEFGDKEAIIWHNKAFSYADLMSLTNQWLTRFKDYGIKEKQIVAFYGEYSPQIIGLIYALMLNKNILVPFTPAIDNDIDTYSAISGIDHFFRFDKNDTYTHSFIDKYPVKNKLITDFYTREVPGLIVFTSGSTGKPKGILQDCDNVMKKFITKRQGWRTILFLMMDHFGGFNTLLSVFAYGGTAVCLPDRNPETVCSLIEKSKADLLPTTPTFLNFLMNSNVHKSYDLSSIKMITYGTEVMTDSTLRKIKSIFPNSRIKQTYGLSELGVLRSKSKSDNSVWVKLGGQGFETKIIDNILWIRSQANMVGYLNAPNPIDEDGWMCTGDEVEVKGEYMRILGRKSDMINVGGQKVFPAEVESVLQKDDNVKEASVVGKSHALMGNIVIAKIALKTPEKKAIITTRLRKLCMATLAKYKVPVKFIIEEENLHSNRFKKLRKA
ncbi:MAG: ANL family adenylate-forming protein [Bacteroidota bacterium]